MSLTESFNLEDQWERKGNHQRDPTWDHSCTLTVRRKSRRNRETITVTSGVLEASGHNLSAPEDENEAEMEGNREIGDPPGGSRSLHALLMEGAVEENRHTRDPASKIEPKQAVAVGRRTKRRKNQPSLVPERDPITEGGEEAAETNRETSR